MGDGDDGGDGPSRRGGALDLDRGWVPLAALALAVCLPILLAVLDAARAGWVPTADGATIVHRSYDMWSAHRPLVGQYSLAGAEGSQRVFSPGPFLYLVLAPAARFGPAWSVPLTLGLLASGCFALALHAARRIGGWWFAVAVAFGLVGTVRASGAATYVEPWNPWASLAPFAALVMVCWLVAMGRRRWLVVAVVLASFMVQSHLTYLPPSLVLLAVALVGGWWPDRTPADADADADADLELELEPEPEPDGSAAVDELTGAGGRAREPRVRPLVAGAVALVVCWSLPLYEQLTSDPGNLSLVSGAASGQGPTFGPGIAVNVWWRASGVYPAFARAAGSQIAELDELRVTAGPAAWVGVALGAAALALIGWAALRRGARDVLVGAVIALGLAVAALATASRIPLDRLIVAPYSLRWVVMAGLVPWVVVVLAVMRFDVLGRWRGDRRLPRWVAAGAVALLAVFALTVSRTDEAAWMSDPAREAGDALVASIEPGDRVLLAQSGRYEIVMTPALALRVRQDGEHPVLIRNFRVGTGDVYGRDGVRCDQVVVLQEASEPPPAEARRIAVVPYDQPGSPQEMAVYLLEDDSAEGQC